MKVVYPIGGLGNSLFHLNLAFDLVKNNNDVILNTYFLRKNFLTRLLKFSIHNTENYLSYFLDKRIKVKSTLNYSIIAFILLHKLRLSKYSDKKWFGLNYPSLDDMVKVNHFFGYFQHINKVNLDLKSNFYKNRELLISQCNNILIKELRNSDNLLLHIRGGDKLKDSIFYYNYKFAKTTFIKFTKVYVVTDDIFQAEMICDSLEMNFEIINSENMFIDFIYISIAKNKFIARSSFSWWASEFSLNDDLVFQPEPYYSHVEWNPQSNVKRIKL